MANTKTNRRMDIQYVEVDRRNPENFRALVTSTQPTTDGLSPKTDRKLLPNLTVTEFNNVVRITVNTDQPRNHDLDASLLQDLTPHGLTERLTQLKRTPRNGIQIVVTTTDKQNTRPPSSRTNAETATTMAFAPGASKLR